eukprot:TRINITY_DN33179_c0_g1_i1.p1 TRINITY_DN33179_c0_g1~~TRINITY_DN33179_c0_g1_i1.p1  ORF type:complete len:510 (-),score=-30.03 TRINITY_DN33179_c0_g1_i1:397-1926(-)
MEEATRPHVVVVPLIAQGHIIPFLELSKLLCKAGLAVSFITTPRNADRIRAQVYAADLPIRLVSLRMPPIEGLANGAENSENVSREQMDSMIVTWHRLAQPYEDWLAGQDLSPSCPTRPVCVITDMFADWVNASSAKFGLPTVVFYTTGAFGTALLHAIVNHDPQKGKGDEEPFDIPGLSFPATMKKSDLAVHMRDQDANPRHHSIKALINKSTEGHMFIFNTFTELDYDGLKHMRALTGKPVLSMGPLLPDDMFEENEYERCRKLSVRGKASDISDDDCLAWLDSRPLRSVVFVCLGSQFLMSSEQSRALAEGLERSGQAFVWAIRSQDPKTALPEGFEERTKDRSLMIWGWAPQLMILAHSSVGAFLSHCGWNSTLECISLGVPMITWPMYADQPLNSKLLVEQHGVAVQICVDVSGVPEPERVSEAIRRLVVDEEGRGMRERAQRLAAHARSAVREGGSSRKNVEYFVEQMRVLDRRDKDIVLPSKHAQAAGAVADAEKAAVAIAR